MVVTRSKTHSNGGDALHAEQSVESKTTKKEKVSFLELAQGLIILIYSNTVFIPPFT